MSCASKQYGIRNEATAANGIGTAGFVVSLVGLIFTCTILCPLGLLISMIGLMKPRRGLAIAGTAIGLLGSIILGVSCFVAVTGYCSAKESFRNAAFQTQTQAAFVEGKGIIEEYRFENSKLPGGIEGNKLVMGVTDGWENSLRFDGEEDAFLLRSAGPDGEFDTPDDMTSDDPLTLEFGGFEVGEAISPNGIYFDAN